MDTKDCVQYLNRQPVTREDELFACLQKCSSALSDAAVDFARLGKESERKRCSDLWAESLRVISRI